jgi:cytochrome c551/c552
LFCQPTHGRFRLRAQTTVAHFKQEIVELFVTATLSGQVHRWGSFVIKQTLRTAMLASALAATALDATAQDGDVAAGHAFAREACKSCHVVEPTNASPRIVVVGPSFQDIANTKGMTATALRVFLTTSHPKMPNLILTPEETSDVIAYILSLRDR